MQHSASLIVFKIQRLHIVPQRLELFGESLMLGMRPIFIERRAGSKADDEADLIAAGATAEIFAAAQMCNAVNFAAQIAQALQHRGAIFFGNFGFELEPDSVPDHDFYFSSLLLISRAVTKRMTLRSG